MHLSDRFLLAFFVRNAILLNRFTDNATCRSWFFSDLNHCYDIFIWFVITSSLQVIACFLFHLKINLNYTTDIEANWVVFICSEMIGLEKTKSVVRIFKSVSDGAHANTRGLDSVLGLFWQLPWPLAQPEPTASNFRKTKQTNIFFKLQWEFQANYVTSRIFLVGLC